MVGVILLTAGAAASAGTLSQKLSAEDPKALVADARKRGDATRGAVLFYQPLMACTKCHTTGKEKNPLGPDLAAVGREASDAHLVDSVLHPSKVIKKGYKSVTIVTTGGKPLIGMIVNETPKEVVIRDAAQNWKEIRIARDEIDELRPSALSIMPTGQVDAMKNREQFLDLVRYLIEIRDGGAKRARELEPDPALYATRQSSELKNAVDGKPLGKPELKMARELFSSRGCVACHHYPYVKGPSLIAISKKVSLNKDGLNLLKTSLASGSVGKWGKLLMPPQAHLQDAERHLLARWVLGLQQSGEKPPGSTARVEDFAAPSGFDPSKWTHYPYHGSRSATIEWNKNDKDLDLRLKGSPNAVAGLYLTGQGRTPTDLVSLAVKKVSAEGKNWAQVGLMISTVPEPQLLGSQARYEWIVRRETNVAGWVYRVRKDVGTGNYELYSSKPVDPGAPVRLEIVRNGDNYEFRANGTLHYTTGDNTSDTYDVKTRDSMVYFGVTFGGGAPMTATIDDLSVGVPLPSFRVNTPATVGISDLSALFIEKRNGAVIQVLDRPVVYRTYLPDAPSRAIAVGLPGGVSFGFDAQNCRLLYAWRGGFMDVSRSWKGMGGWYSKLLGQKFHTAPPGFPLRIGDPETKPVVQFKGYDLVEGHPVFKYLVDGTLVRHQIMISEVDKKAPSIQHLFRLPGNKKRVYFVAGENAGKSYASEDAVWTDGRWKVSAEKLTQFSIGVTR